MNEDAAEEVKGQGIEEEMKVDARIGENIDDGNANGLIQEENPHSDHQVSQRSYNAEMHDLELASDISLDQADFEEGERAAPQEHSQTC